MIIGLQTIRQSRAKTYSRDDNNSLPITMSSMPYNKLHWKVALWIISIGNSDLVGKIEQRGFPLGENE